MRAAWLDQYPPGTRSQIDPGQFASIHDILTTSSRKFAQYPAFRGLGATITFSELEKLSRHFATALKNLPGIEARSRVALMMPNVLQYPVALFGVLRAGLVVVNINPLYTARELAHQVNDSGAEVILVLENFAHTVERALPSMPSIRYVITTEAGDLTPTLRRWSINLGAKYVRRMVPPWNIPAARSFLSMLDAGARVSSFDDTESTHDDLAMLQYTGGTTGKPRGAMLTHGNLVANVLQASAWVERTLQEGSEVAITALPLYHIFSLTTCCLLFVKFGGMQVLIPNPRDLHSFVNELRRSRFTTMVGVNTLFNGLLNTPGFIDLDFSTLKFAIGGGAAIHQSVAERWQHVTRAPLVQGYGLTEASPLVACNPLDSWYTGSIGLPMPSTEVSIRDDGENELPTGREGEIWVRGPQVTRGYWGHPDETPGAITAEGWLRTGDLGVMDNQGYLHVTDRKKDMIIVSGFNVYPNEVEGVIRSMPGVVEAAVVGVPNALTGEAVKAFVVLESQGTITAEAVIAWCREHLTNYKVPRTVEFCRELPKNPIGKILRRELRVANPAATEVKTTAAAGSTT